MRTARRVMRLGPGSRGNRRLEVVKWKIPDLPGNENLLGQIGPGTHCLSRREEARCYSVHRYAILNSSWGRGQRSLFVLVADLPERVTRDVIGYRAAKCIAADS